MSRRLQALIAALAVVAAAQPSRAGPAPPVGASAASVSAPTARPLPEVTIRSRRELALRVAKFVNRITVPENGGEGGLARWLAPPVCPLVSGLPPHEGEFILERFSEIARTAHVPLAGERCRRPNLYILVTLQPEALLTAMAKRNRPFTFGYDPSHIPATMTPASVVNEFIATPRPVRVWYNLQLRTPEGLPPSKCYSDPEAMAALRAGGYPSGLAATDFAPCNPQSAESRLVLDVVRTFWSVFVVVDQSRLQGVSRGQLADYVAMVALAKLKLDTHPTDARTILTLFDGTPQAAPAGLTDWDQAFLKSLYTTDQASRLQRSEISHAMVPQILQRGP